MKVPIVVHWGHVGGSTDAHGFSAKQDQSLSALKLLQAEQVEMKSDIASMKPQIAAAADMANAAHARAVSAETAADAALKSAGRVELDAKGGTESVLADLAFTKGKLADINTQLQNTTDQIKKLTTSDDDLRSLVQAASKNSMGEALREVFGKNPKLAVALTGLLVVLAQVLTQRFLLTPGAPNQGVLPAPSPSVRIETPTIVAPPSP